MAFSRRAVGWAPRSVRTEPSIENGVCTCTRPEYYLSTATSALPLCLVLGAISALLFSTPFQYPLSGTARDLLTDQFSSHPPSTLPATTMAAVAVLRVSTRLSLSLRAATLPALNVSAGRLYYATSGTRMFSNSTRTLEPVKELNVPERSEPQTAGVEGPHRRSRKFLLIAISQSHERSYCL